MEETLKIKKTDIKMYGIVKFPFYPDHPEKGYYEPIFVAVCNDDNNNLIARRVVRLEWDAVILLPDSYDWNDFVQSNNNILVLYDGRSLSEVLSAYETLCPIIADSFYNHREVYTLLK